MNPRVQPPCLICLSDSTIWRDTASARVKACSETYGAPYAGVFETVMPDSSAANKSTWSTPVPQTDNILRRLQFAKTLRVNFTEDLMFIIQSASLSLSIVEVSSLGLSKYHMTSCARLRARA